MKKNILTFSILAVAALLLSSCKGFLEINSQTAVTSDYLYSSPDGLEKAVVGLYDMDRSTVFDQNAVGIAVMLDASTDIVVYRGGTTASLYRLNDNNASVGYFKSYWQTYYKIIGKSNEIIAGAKKFGTDDPRVQRVLGEACLLRARSYLLLYQRFERLYLNLEPTSYENAFDRTFRAASKEELFEAMKADLAVAEEYLPWTPQNGTAGTPEYGRCTKALAMHVRAQVAMWEEDWDTAAQKCDDLFDETKGALYYHLLASPGDVFSGADLNHAEALYVYQYSGNKGGGGSVSGGVVTGHRLSLITTPNYNKVSGMVWSVDNGGYGWGRIYPNTYLLSLYDQAKDTRYSQLYKFKYTYNDPNPLNIPKDKKIGDEVEVTAAQYLECAHPASLKYFDKWTNADEPSRTSSYKDVIVVRLAESALIGAEAYLRKGNMAKAVEFYNRTYTRAGNTAVSSVTMDDILDEYARELNFEGVRWPLLKRTGLLGERVRLHEGDSKREDPKLSQDYIMARQNFDDLRDWRWPIPQDELDLMPGFGQNDGWL